MADTNKANRLKQRGFNMHNITQFQIKAFIEGYLTAALWSSTDELNGDSVNLDDFEWADGESEKLHADCLAFITTNAVDLIAAQDHPTGYDGWDCAGHDFWLTRNGHGAGFWDRGLGELGERLTQASKAFGEVHLYLGDDELVYVG
jgi:hypothetical protein